MQEAPNIMIMLKIVELYPHSIKKMAVLDEDTGKWSCALMRIDNDNLFASETIYSFDNYVYDNDVQALSAMDKLLTYVRETVKVMSN